MTFNDFLDSLTESIDRYDDTERFSDFDGSDIDIDGTVSIDINGLVEHYFSGGERHPNDGANIKNIVKQFLIKQLENNLFIRPGYVRVKNNIVTYKTSFTWNEARDMENDEITIPESTIEEICEAMQDHDWDSSPLRIKTGDTSIEWLKYHNIKTNGNIAILNAAVNTLIENIASEWWIDDYISCEFDSDLEDIADEVRREARGMRDTYDSLDRERMRDVFGSSRYGY